MRLTDRISVALNNPTGLATTIGPPVLPPTNNYQKVKIDLATGIIYYYDSDSSTWEVASGDTHMGNTNLTFTGNRTYDVDNRVITYNDADSIIINTVGAAGSSINLTNGGDYSAVDIDLKRVDITGSSGSGTASSFVYVTDAALYLGNSVGAYYLGDGAFVPTPTASDVTPDYLVGIDSTTGRLYRHSKQVSDTAYGAGWDGVTTIAPSKNAVYDKIQTLVSDTVYGAGWNGDTTTAPSKNAVYDKIESLAGGSNFATTDLTLTGNRTHTGSNLRSLTIQNLTALTLNTGIGNQEILLDNVGGGVRVISDSIISQNVDLGGGVTGSISVTGGQFSATVDAGVDDSSITMLPGLLGIMLRDTQGNYSFDGTAGSLLPLLDDIGEPSEGVSTNMLTLDGNGRIFRKPLPGADTNLGNTDITFVGDRIHNADGYNFKIENIVNLDLFETNNFDIKVSTAGVDVAQITGNTAGYAYMGANDGGGNISTVTVDYTGGVTLYNSNGLYSITGLPTYADDTAAGVGGLIAGRLYKTSTGVLMVKL